VCVFKNNQNKNITNFYAKCHYSKLPELINLFSVLICEPAINDEDLDKERNIVIEEIRNTYDDPVETLFNKVYKFTFGDNPITKTVAGSPDNINSITRQDVLDHLRKYYAVNNLVVGLTGKLPSLDEVTSLLEKSSFTKVPQLLSPHEFRPKIQHELKSNIYVKHTKNQQTYLAIGFPLSGIYSNNKFALQIINSILNGSMSSRLFIKIREEKGLVYSISSEITNYEEGGVYFIITSFETSDEKCLEVMRAILSELHSIANDGVTEEELVKPISASGLLGEQPLVDRRM